MRSKQQSPPNPGQRRSIVSVSSVTSNTLHFRSPWISAWWSAAFPGFGHYMTNNYLLGFILMALEYILNVNIRLNLAIYYSMTGHFEQAKEVINMTWFIAYIAIYVFAIWDSYRRTVESNKAFQLAYKETTKIQPFQFTAMEINLLEKKKPWVAFIWSFIMPGLGHIYLQRIPIFLYSIFWWGVVLYFSKVNHGLYYSMIGEFRLAKAAINVEWLLFLPSIYGFAMYSAYAQSVENNKIFEIAQARYLKNKYQQQNYDPLFQARSK